MIQNQYGNSGVDGIVNLMQMNYSMKGVPVEVSGAGNEVTIDFQVPSMVESYHTCLRIVNNPMIYSSADVAEAKRLIEKTRNDISQAKPQTAQDRQMFAKARVTKLTFRIGGVDLVSVPL